MKAAFLGFVLLFGSSSVYASLTEQGPRSGAVELFRAGMYGEIARHFREKASEDASVKLLLALSYRTLGLVHQSDAQLRELYYRRTPFRPYAAYRLGIGFEERGDVQGALRWYKCAVDASEPPGSAFPKSADGRAVTLSCIRRMTNIAIKDGSHFSTVEKVLTKASARYPAALYHLGVLLLNRGEEESAVRTFVEVLRSVRDEKVARRTLETLTTDFGLVEKAEAKGFSKRELLQSCLKSGLYRNALFVTYLLPYGPDVARIRALCFAGTGDYESAALLYDEYYRQFKDPDGLLQAAIACYDAGDAERARTYLAKYFAESPADGRANADALSLRLRLERDKTPPEAFVRSAEAFVNGNRAYPQLDRVIQETFYFTLQKKLSDHALEYLKAAYPSIRNPLFKAWGSYLLALYHDKRHYAEALSLFPGSYYYHMAAGELELESDLVREADALFDLGNFDEALALYVMLYSKGVDEGHVRERITRIVGRIPSVSRLYGLKAVNDGGSPSILFTLYRAGVHDEIESLIEEAMTMEGEKEDYYYYYLLSLIAYEKGKPFIGIRNAEEMLRTVDPRYTMFLPSDVLKLLYPDVFRELIRERTKGAALKFDDFFVLSIIREESRYNHRAQSRRGAVGLMQLLPSTARWIRGERLDRADLFDPGINIDAGVLYLKFLSQRFRNDAEVLAAYNGGPGNVKKWLAASANGNERKFIEEIPFPETRNYVKRVLTSYAMYRSLYGAL